ncbi:class I SAM-dependent methyltransferase [Salibacterium halotolerans]|uniref:Putative SAM-dependent methyltransferase n=1 Tax=Salibacterium halotolerans TaxID=1884432 RepID=A0A1I5UYC8_9BACI|nr:class I SAM-dependent methyltransferase [Salibacterium halotolerans]SFQ00275.1 Putative SAM-dependent methyltransferase [Salibacterium halotolerans]
MIITTAKKALPEETEEARTLAGEWGVAFEARRKRSFQKWLAYAQEPIYAVGKTQDKLYHPKALKPLAFHPSMAWIRYQRMARGERDPMVEAMGLQEGMSVLDTTMGLGSDSIVSRFVTGANGYVQAVEWNPYVTHLVAKGMKMWESSSDEFNVAMRTIDIISGSFEKVLEELPDNSFDVIYMDPMFDEALNDSVHLSPLRSFACHRFPARDAVHKAVRKAARRVVIKTRGFPDFLREMGFAAHHRAVSRFSYAVFVKGESS